MIRIHIVDLMSDGDEEDMDTLTPNQIQFHGVGAGPSMSAQFGSPRLLSKTSLSPDNSMYVAFNIETSGRVSPSNSEVTVDSIDLSLQSPRRHLPRKEGMHNHNAKQKSHATTTHSSPASHLRMPLPSSSKTLQEDSGSSGSSHSSDDEDQNNDKGNPPPTYFENGYEEQSDEDDESLENEMVQNMLSDLVVPKRNTSGYEEYVDPPVFVDKNNIKTKESSKYFDSDSSDSEEEDDYTEAANSMKTLQSQGSGGNYYGEESEVPCERFDQDDHIIRIEDLPLDFGSMYDMSSHIYQNAATHVSTPDDGSKKLWAAECRYLEGSISGGSQSLDEISLEELDNLVVYPSATASCKVATPTIKSPEGFLLFPPNVERFSDEEDEDEEERSYGQYEENIKNLTHSRVEQDDTYVPTNPNEDDDDYYNDDENNEEDDDDDTNPYNSIQTDKAVVMKLREEFNDSSSPSSSDHSEEGDSDSIGVIITKDNISYDFLVGNNDDIDFEQQQEAGEEEVDKTGYSFDALVSESKNLEASMSSNHHIYSSRLATNIPQPHPNFTMNSGMKYSQSFSEMSSSSSSSDTDDAQYKILDSNTQKRNTHLSKSSKMAGDSSQKLSTNSNSADVTNKLIMDISKNAIGKMTERISKYLVDAEATDNRVASNLHPVDSKPDISAHVKNRNKTKLDSRRAVSSDFDGLQYLTSNHHQYHPSEYSATSFMEAKREIGSDVSFGHLKASSSYDIETENMFLLSTESDEHIIPAIPDELINVFEQTIRNAANITSNSELNNDIIRAFTEIVGKYSAPSSQHHVTNRESQVGIHSREVKDGRLEALQEGYGKESKDTKPRTRSSTPANTSATAFSDRHASPRKGEKKKVKVSINSRDFEESLVTRDILISRDMEDRRKYVKDMEDDREEEGGGEKRSQKTTKKSKKKPVPLVQLTVNEEHAVNAGNGRAGGRHVYSAQSDSTHTIAGNVGNVQIKAYSRSPTSSPKRTGRKLSSSPSSAAGSAHVTSVVGAISAREVFDRFITKKSSPNSGAKDATFPLYQNYSSSFTSKCN